MVAVVIGSTAAREHLPDWRKPRDLDVFATKPIDGAEVFWDDRLHAWFDENRVATLDELYTIKASHAYWELHGTWQKHMSDLLALKQAGAVLLPDLHQILYGIWQDKHGAKVLDLNQEAEEFFADAVTRVYVHDSIHESVAYYDRPLYERCLADGHSVKMDMQKVWGLPFLDQVKLFREEIYVTALERLIIPNNYKYSAGAAYQWALRRTITSLTKGKSALFLVDNFHQFYRADIDYVARHHNKSNKLIPLEEK